MPISKTVKVSLRKNVHLLLSSSFFQHQHTVTKKTLHTESFLNTNYSARMADCELSCGTFLSSGLIWAISMATLLVFHTQEWLVKYSKTIMDL